ncbi:unnamed protein product [Lampetra fluviatilis]
MEAVMVVMGGLPTLWYHHQQQQRNVLSGGMLLDATKMEELRSSQSPPALGSLIAAPHGGNAAELKIDPMLVI